MMENNFIFGIVSLIKSALTGSKADVPAEFDFVQAYNISKSHGIIPIVYYGIINSQPEIDETIKNRFFTSTCESIAVGEKQNYWILKLSDEFEKSGVDFMPLKGSVIRSLYPKQEMRSMGDADILIRAEQYDRIIPILKENGFSFVKESNNEFCWSRSPFYLELHRYLVSPSHKDYFKVLGNGWQYARRAEGFEHKYEMSHEDFLVFLFVHFAKHYRSSGIGIKHMTDIWLYLNKYPDLDMDLVKRKLDGLNLWDFYQNVLKTVNVWFENEKYDNISYLITKKIFSSGAFGTKESSVKSNALKETESGGIKDMRVKRFFHSVFLPYKNMSMIFPVLEKLPILLPFMWVYRILHALFYKNDSIARQFNSIKNLSREQIAEYENELRAVGLDFDFRE